MNWVILTRPPHGAKHLVKCAWELAAGKPREGHAVLLKSTVAAMRGLGLRVALNPLLPPGRPTHCLVAYGENTLHWALDLKQRDPAVWVGIAPTFADAGSEMLRQIAGGGWDTLLAASPWHAHLFAETHPLLAARTSVWPCGVDTETWKPVSGSAARHGILLYIKRAPTGLADAIGHIVKEAGLPLETIRYGAYTPLEFREALRRREAAIFLSDWESQGIALAEAWSCDVPTLAWTPCSPDPWQVTAPWLCAETGFVFHDLQQLSELLSRRAWSNCRPRLWTQAHLSPSCSAQLLLQAARSSSQQRPDADE